MENENVPGILIAENDREVVLTAQGNSDAAIILHMLFREFPNTDQLLLWKIVYPTLCYYQEIGQRFNLVLEDADGWLTANQRAFLVQSMLPRSRESLEEAELNENKMYAQVLERLNPELRTIVLQQIEMLEVAY